MGTAEEILENIMCCTIEEDADLDVKSNYYYQHDDVVKAIEQAQKEAYNQAIEDAAEKAEVAEIEIIPPKPYDQRPYTKNIVNRDSILKLKK